MNNFFGAGSPYLSHPLLTAERSAAEVTRILDELDEAPSRVLDVGCGFGRHAVEFARRGCAVVALDPSSTMLEAARERADEAGVAIEFRQGTGDSLADVAIYDLAVCLFTTLGQQTPDGIGDHSLLDAMARSCHTGATAVIEVPERERALSMLVEEELLGPPSTQTRVTRTFDTESGILHEHFEPADGPADGNASNAGVFDLAYRLYSTDELHAMLIESGFVDIRITDEALVPPPPTFMTAFARK